MDAKHTPGPWRVSEQSPTIIKQDMRMIGNESGVLIGSASGYTGSGFFPTDEEAVANARLIAAAPELLEALEEVMSMLGSELVKDTLGYEWHDKARAAIAKATGSDQ